MNVTFVEFLALVAVTLTPTQLVFARVAFEGVAVPDLAPAQQKVAAEIFGSMKQVSRVAAAIVELISGARSGKTYVFALRLLYLALTVSLAPLAPGEIAAAPIVGPDMRLARIPLRYIKGIVHRAASLFGACVTGDTADEITIRRSDGRVVELSCLPATRGGSALRGRYLVGALVTEFAFFRDENSVINDAEIYRALAPRLLPGAQLLIESTPWARAGLLWDFYKENWGKPKTALVARASTLTMRRGDPAVELAVERERLRDPRNARREFDAEFADDVSSVFAEADIDACVDAGVTNRPFDPSCVYEMAIDVGLRRDWSVACVYHVELKKRLGGPPIRVLFIDALRVLKPKLLGRLSLDDVERMIDDLHRRYRNVRTTRGDIHFFDSLAPRFQARGRKFEELKMTPDAQARRVAALASRLAGRTVRLLDDKDLIQQLRDAREFRKPGGLAAYGVPESKGHDDILDCVLVAADAATEMPVSVGASDYRVEVRTEHEPGAGLRVTPQWFERRNDLGQQVWVPVLPPEGSPAREEAADRLAANGAYLPERQGEVIEGASTRIHGVGLNMKIRV